MKQGVKKVKFMLTCKQASQLISQSLDRPLSLSGRVKLKFHLFICDACTRFNKQMGQLRTAVHRMRQDTENDSTIELPADAKARITNAITSKHY
jgi:predicted anti-sigma-YlaC factor YlaD